MSGALTELEDMVDRLKAAGSYGRHIMDVLEKVVEVLHGHEDQASKAQAPAKDVPAVSTPEDPSAVLAAPEAAPEVPVDPTPTATPEAPPASPEVQS